MEHIRNMVRSEATQGRIAGLGNHLEPWNNSKNSSDSGDTTNSLKSSSDATTDKEKNGDSDLDSDMEEEKNSKLGTPTSSRESTPADIDGIRKERNRMHAKLTRDRKKLFTSRVQQMINSLERQNTFMRNRLATMDSSNGTSILDSS